MTHTDIINHTAKWLKNHPQNIAVPNCTTILKELKSATESGEIPDVIAWCSWASVLVEVKTSRSDFLKDRCKPFRISPAKGVGNFRYYISPPNIIKPNEIPEYWGLLQINENEKIEIIKVAQNQFANTECERTILLSLIRRNKIKLL